MQAHDITPCWNLILEGASLWWGLTLISVTERVRISKAYCSYCGLKKIKKISHHCNRHTRMCCLCSTIMIRCQLNPLTLNLNCLVYTNKPIQSLNFTPKNKAGLINSWFTGFCNLDDNIHQQLPWELLRKSQPWVVGHNSTGFLSYLCTHFAEFMCPEKRQEQQGKIWKKDGGHEAVRALYGWSTWSIWQIGW